MNYQESNERLARAVKAVKMLDREEKRKELVYANKIKTLRNVDDLGCPDLDRYVAKALGIHHNVFFPSTSWAAGGKIIESEGISIYSPDTGADDCWGALHPTAIRDKDGLRTISNEYSGPTPLIAAMKCVVAAYFGEYVK